MPAANDDLLPLFATEARERLERVAAALPGADEDAEQCRVARRELHALKGASRMMGLGRLAETCHQAEELLAEPRHDDLRRAQELVDELVRAVEGVAGAEPPASRAAPGGTEPPGPGPGEHRSVARDLRVAPGVLDELADRSARLRIQGLSLARLVERCEQLATFAHEGLGDADARTALATLATSLERLGHDLARGQRAIQRLANRQLEGHLGLQMQPLRPFLDGLARHARELARSLGKQVQVEVAAGESQLDRRITEALREAFVHLVRNAVDHGIEDAVLREEEGKPPVGRLGLVAESEAERVRIRVVDDGSGIDAASVADAARRRGLVDQDEADRMSQEETLRLLFQPGFSTRDQVSEVSGRGIGLDAVEAAVRGVGGATWIHSRLGQGTEIVVEVPLARRGERVTVLRVGRALVAIPSTVVRGFLQIRPGDLERDGSDLYLHREDGRVPVLALGPVLHESMHERLIVVDARVGDGRLALGVDAVAGEEEVMLRPLPPGLGAPATFDSMAVLAAGRPVPVLDPVHLLGTAAGMRPARPLETQGVQVLLVEDSRVTREMLRRVLEDGGVVVTAVSSAEDGWARLRQRSFDCVITDIEMPGMDGLELTRRIRADETLMHLPVIVVSTRSRSADRVAGLEAGADAYLAKQELDARELVELAWRMGRAS